MPQALTMKMVTIPAIRYVDPATEFFTMEGCHIIELSNTVTDPDVSIARARVEQGCTTRWHRLHETAERYVILDGRGLMELEGMAEQTVHAGDVVLIPPGCPQRISNTGQTDLIFLAICTPRFHPLCYEDVDAALSARAASIRGETI